MATQNLVRKILFTFYFIDLLKYVNMEINISLYFLDSSSEGIMHLGLQFYLLHTYIHRPTIYTLTVTSHSKQQSIQPLPEWEKLCSHDHGTMQDYRLVQKDEDEKFFPAVLVSPCLM